jgi:hypothetical protein
MIKVIHDMLTNQTQEVEVSAAEAQHIERLKNEANEQRLKSELKIKEKQEARKIILDRLGITEEEASSLFY